MTMRDDWKKLDADLRPPYQCEITSGQVRITSNDHVIAVMAIDRRYAMVLAPLIAWACNKAAT